MTFESAQGTWPLFPSIFGYKIAVYSRIRHRPLSFIPPQSTYKRKGEVYNPVSKYSIETAANPLVSAENRALVQFLRNPAARTGTHPQKYLPTYVMTPARSERVYFILTFKKTGTAWSQCDTFSQAMVMTDRFADKVSSDIGRSDTQWVDSSFRGDEANGCLSVGLGICSSQLKCAPNLAKRLQGRRNYRDEVVLKNVFWLQ